MKRYFFCVVFILCLGFGKISAAATNAQLDNAARLLPVEKGQTVESVVKNLIEPIYTDKEKAQVLALFVAYQMQKNGYAAKEAKKASIKRQKTVLLPSGNMLKMRFGTSFDYADLYQRLCAAAGLKSVVVIGYAGRNVRQPNRSNPKLQVVNQALRQWNGQPNYEMQQYEAAWNTVQIDKGWILVDTYWLSGGEKAYTGITLQDERDLNRFLKQREQKSPTLGELTRNKNIDASFFDASPRTFIQTHFPFDEKWQLLPVPVTLSSFLR